MLILTTTGQALNACHIVRLFLQSDRDQTAPDDHPAHVHLMAQLSTRHCVLVAPSLTEESAQQLLCAVARCWGAGRSVLSIAALLPRLQQGEAVTRCRKEVCL